MAPCRRALGELVEQPGLADPRLAGDDDPAGAGRLDRVERSVERRQLLAPADEPLVCLRNRDGNASRRLAPPTTVPAAPSA